LSIARMKKLSVVGHASIRRELMLKLMELGVVDIVSQTDKLAADSQWKDLVKPVSRESDVVRFENWISKVSQVLDAIAKYCDLKAPLIKTRKPVSAARFEEVLRDRSDVEQKILNALAQLGNLSKLHAAQNKVEAVRLSIIPWKELDIPFEIHGTHSTDLIIGAIPALASRQELEAQLAAKAERAMMLSFGQDPEQQYLAVITLKEDGAAVNDVLKSFGFNRFHQGDMEGTAEENIRKCEEQLAQIEEKKNGTIEAIRGFREYQEQFQFFHDDLVLHRNLASIKSRLVATRETFYMEGWLPRAAAVKVEEVLLEKECYFEMRDPEKDETHPVLLANKPLSSPFEAITKLYALPDSRAIDATPFFALSYAIFFGMMLSDAAYGLILTIATFVILKKMKPEGMTEKMIKMFFFCGISTIFWGAMFGGYFGDLVTVVAKTFFQADVAIKPLWFNPMEDPMKLLMFSLLLGGIHLFIGMGLNAYMAIRDGRLLDALCDTGLWYILLIGLVLLLAGVAAPIGQWMSIIGAVGILLTGGRYNKGLGKLVGGLGSLYGITGYLSDVLSYSRLLALGLATGVIASVVNTLGSLAGGGITGLILFIIAFCIGHTYNMSINALGSFVHSCRLQYVEFFGKFYQSGGETFDPFNENTKYIQIIREENK